MKANLPPLEKEPQRLGVLGGTFDPPHYGHLLMAEQARLDFELDQVFLVPAGVPPHKRGEQSAPLSSAQERYEMVLLAASSSSFFQVWEFELKKKKPSYTLETLNFLEKALPRTRIFFIMGRDSLAEIFSWKNPREILTGYDIIVVSREGDPRSLIADIEEEIGEAKIHRLLMPAVNISSTGLRERVRGEKSLTFLTPPPVENYIRKNGLYR